MKNRRIPRGAIKAFREHLNKLDDLFPTKYRNGKFKQLTRKYGDYVYNQDREKFIVEMTEWLKTNPL